MLRSGKEKLSVESVDRVLYVLNEKKRGRKDEEIEKIWVHNFYILSINFYSICYNAVERRTFFDYVT